MDTQCLNIFSFFVITYAAFVVLPCISVLKEVFLIQWKCVYKGQTYNVGDIIPNHNPCLQCKCFEGWKGPTSTQCYKIKCPWFLFKRNPQCRARKLPGHCCPLLDCGNVADASRALVDELLGRGKSIVFTEHIIRTFNATSKEIHAEEITEVPPPQQRQLYHAIMPQQAQPELPDHDLAHYESTDSENKTIDTPPPCASVSCAFPCTAEPAGKDGCSRQCECPQTVNEACQKMKCPENSNCNAECHVIPGKPYCEPFCRICLPVPLCVSPCIVKKQNGCLECICEKSVEAGNKQRAYAEESSEEDTVKQKRAEKEDGKEKEVKEEKQEKNDQ